MLTSLLAIPQSVTLATPPHAASLLLRMAGIRLSNFIQPYLPSVGLSFLQYTTLSIISSRHGEPVRHDTIQKMLRADDRDIVFQTVQLVDRGLLLRTSDPKPPHSVSLTITELGQLSLSTIDRQVEADMLRLSQGFTEDEWEGGMSFLLKLSREVATRN